MRVRNERRREKPCFFGSLPKKSFLVKVFTEGKKVV